MAFLAKTDPFALTGTGNPGAGILECVAVSDNASASLVEAHDEDGTLIAHEVFGQQIAPSADYKVKKSGTLEDIVLGAVTTYDTKRVVLTNFTVNTSAGGETTVTASGEEVEASSDGTCPATFTLPDIVVGVCHHAKALLSAFTIDGTGCYLQSANYTFACALGKATKDGVTIAHGVYEAYAEVQIEIIQTSSTAPTLTAGTASGWFVSSPLSMTNPDADYPTWSATLRKHLTKDVAQSSS